MRWAVAVLTALVALAGPARAAGYDDFTSGMTADLRGDYERAIVAFTAALAAPDLVAAYKPAAYRGRASAYMHRDKCQEGMTDVKAFEALRPTDTSIAYLRIWAELCLKDAVAARKDLDTLAKGKLGSADLFMLARLEWRFSLYDDATVTAADAFKVAGKKDYATPYILVWQALTAFRNNKFDPAPITAGIANLKLDEWPLPVLDLYLGKQTPAGVEKEARSWRKSRSDAQHCEANFYTAEWYLGRNDTASATPLLLTVMKQCPNDFLERLEARFELDRLKVPVPAEE